MSFLLSGLMRAYVNAASLISTAIFYAGVLQQVMLTDASPQNMRQADLCVNL
jgi:hypothetical protein